uniref:FP protein C-terminal domain-containing protein n=1 Tax=Cacopsylla melanoneura TaxID=428564 RepID=A0A8D9FGA8_9HEMI
MKDKHMEEQEDRRSNVIVHKWPQHKNEDILYEIQKIAAKLGFKTPTKEILGGRRIVLKKSDPQVPKPIVISLKDRATREKWTTAFNELKLWKEKWYLNEHLSQYNQYLISQAREWAKKNNWEYVWSKACRVMVRKTKSSQVRELTNLEQLKEWDSKDELSPKSDNHDSIEQKYRMKKDDGYNEAERKHRLTNLLVRNYYHKTNTPIMKLVEEIGHKLGFSNPMEDVFKALKPRIT